jgi:hypothetical protein
LRLAVPAALIPWSPPRIVGVTGDSVHRGTQDLEAQVGPDTWIMEIRTYLKTITFPITVHQRIGLPVWLRDTR